MNENKDRPIFGGDYLDRVERFAKSNRVLIFNNVFLLIVILVLARALAVSEPVVIVDFPANVEISKTGEKVGAGNQFGSEAFWKVWANGMIKPLTEITAGGLDDPNNISAVIADISRYMTPGDQDKYSNMLKGFENAVRANAITQKFRVDKTTVTPDKDGETAKALIEGVAKLTIGNSKIEKSCSYQLNFKKDGYVYLTHFKTDCFDIGSK